MQERGGYRHPERRERDVDDGLLWIWLSVCVDPRNTVTHWLKISPRGASRMPSERRR